MDGVTPAMEIGASTEILAGEGHILTAGGIDAHIHFISPQQIHEALYSGITTMKIMAPGQRPAPMPPRVHLGPWNIARMYEAVETFR